MSPKETIIYVRRIPVIMTEVVDGYVMEVPSMPGCLSQGDTMTEAKKNIKNAMKDWIRMESDKDIADSEQLSLGEI